MAKKKTPDPQDEAPVEVQAEDTPATEHTEIPTEQHSGDEPHGTTDGGDTLYSEDSSQEASSELTREGDEANDPETDDSQLGALFQEMGSAAPLMVDGTQSEPLDALLAGGGLADSTADVSGAVLDSVDASAAGPGASADTPETPPQISAPEGRSDYVLTIEARSRIQTEQEQQEIIWHELRNSHIAGRMLTGTLDGVEQTESGLTIAVVDYKGFRVAIPLREMMLYNGPELHGAERSRLMDRLNRILVTMLGSEIDFIVRGIDMQSRSVVASRRAAMLRKRQTFYMDVNDLGETLIYEGRVVQARVVGVSEKILRVEVFGVECPIFARDLSWTWFGDARDQYSVGDRVLVRVLTIDKPDLNNIAITADVRSVSSSTSQENLKKITVQCRYAGRVTDVRNGVVFIRLNNGVNAIAHTCYDRRMPGKKDDVSFAVTRVDEERGIALGIITRIIKQNL